MTPMERKAQPDDVGLQGPAPDWVGSLMPRQRHAEIVAEIKKLQEEADQLQDETRQMESMAGLLWQTGRPLQEVVRDVFRSLGFAAELTSGESVHDVTVNLGDGRRLLVDVTGTDGNITKKSPTIRKTFEMTQDGADDGDRIVLAANVYCDRPLTDREWLDPATPDALMILTGLGSVLVTTVTLFRIWKLSTENPQAAADHVLQLHAATAGAFTLEAEPSAETSLEDDESDAGNSNGSWSLRHRWGGALKT